MSEIWKTSATEMADRIGAGDLSPVRAVGAHLDRIADRNDRTNAYVTILDEAAREQSHDADQAAEDDAALGPLHGVPVGIKDLSGMAGVRTTFGSKPFADNVAEADAILVERLRAAGAVPLGKTNACEFGHKGTTDNEIFGPTSTPFDPERNAGGSSGGSAAAVAAGLAPIAMGGDGGGSIRIPAACCGVYGFNPSYGRVPHEVRPDAFNEHTPFVRRGPLSRTVRDSALVMEVIGGPDERDPFSLPDDGVDYLGALDRSIEAYSVAYSPDLGCFPLDDDVRSVMDDAVGAFESAGAQVFETDPDFDHTLREMFDAWKTTWEAMYAGLAEGFRAGGIDLAGEHREELTPSFGELIEAGLDLSVPDLKRANRVRTSMRDAINEVFDDHDLLVTSTLSRPPVENTEDTIGPERVNGEFVGKPIGWCLTYPFNLVENPAASVPAGLDDRGLPVGMQVVGPRHDDEAVLAGSAAVERERPWIDTYPW
jgi:amidase/aspartyl-tRNA(Asn)/glutamyl-tRNA(Gln) amidotransferase subunit A